MEFVFFEGGEGHKDHKQSLQCYHSLGLVHRTSDSIRPKPDEFVFAPF